MNPSASVPPYNNTIQKETEPITNVVWSQLIHDQSNEFEPIKSEQYDRISFEPASSKDVQLSPDDSSSIISKSCSLYFSDEHSVDESHFCVENENFDEYESSSDCDTDYAPKIHGEYVKSKYKINVKPIIIPESKKEFIPRTQPYYKQHLELIDDDGSIAKQIEKHREKVKKRQIKNTKKAKIAKKYKKRKRSKHMSDFKLFIIDEYRMIKKMMS